MVLIRLHSDNFEGELMTVDAYEEVALQMSTGDSATHTTEVIVTPESYVDFDTVWQLDSKSGELIEPLADPEFWEPAQIV